jgi:hypothetical protein
MRRYVPEDAGCIAPDTKVPIPSTRLQCRNPGDSNTERNTSDSSQFRCLYMLNFKELMPYSPVTVAERSKAWTVFARSEPGIMGSNPTQGMDVWCMCAFFCAFVVLCLGIGLATSWSPIQGVLPSVNDQETEKSALCSKSGSKPPSGGKRK